MFQEPSGKVLGLITINDSSAESSSSPSSEDDESSSESQADDLAIFELDENGDFGENVQDGGNDDQIGNDGGNDAQIGNDDQADVAENGDAADAAEVYYKKAKLQSKNLI